MFTFNKAKKGFSLKEFQKIEGWRSDYQGKKLYEVAQLLPEGCHVLEIGVWKGKSTYCIGKGLPEGGNITVIDPFNADGEEGSKDAYEGLLDKTPLIEHFKSNMRTHGLLDKIEILEGYSNAFVDREFQLDLLFIDGDHSIKGATFDYEHFEKHVKPGGYLIFDDYRPERKDLGPTYVVDNIIRSQNNYEWIDSENAIWVGRKK